MVVKIAWSDLAKFDRREIFTYWNHRNQSKNYSQKLNYLFNKHIEVLYEFPLIGKPTDIKDIRFLIVVDYLIFYEYASSVISIIRIWDSRRNPDSIAKSIRK